MEELQNHEFDKKWTKFSLFSIYQAVRNENSFEIIADDSKYASVRAGYACSRCEKQFYRLSSFLLHSYRHSDPQAILNDIKKEEKCELVEDKSFKIKIKLEKEDELPINEVTDLKVKTTKSINQIESLSLNDSLHRKFICYYCEATFVEKRLLKHHLKYHSYLLQSTCDICFYPFNSFQDEKEHYFKNHKQNGSVCRICQKYCVSLTFRKLHEQLFHSIKQLTCVDCKYGFMTIQKVKSHVEKYHKVDTSEKVFKCFNCSKKFVTERDKINHYVETHLEVTDYSVLKAFLNYINKDSGQLEALNCSFCNKSFLNQKQVFLHEKRQHLTFIQDDLGYTCPVCDTFFVKRENGLKHARRSHGLRINKKKSMKNQKKNFNENIHKNQISTQNCYKCNSCEIGFENNSAFLKHCRISHKTQPILFQCGVCEKELKSFRNLREHVEAVHEKRLQYWCDICGKGYSRKSDIKSHILVKHMQSVRFTCSICTKSFPESGQLKQHQKIHGVIKQYSCNICSKAFSQKSGLTQHAQTHSTVKKFQCEVCNESFKFASAYYTHRKLHLTPNKLNNCEECGKMCPSRFSLYVHCRTYHSNQSFSCSECGREFRRKDTLKNHLLKQHVN